MTNSSTKKLLKHFTNELTVDNDVSWICFACRRKFANFALLIGAPKGEIKIAICLF